VLQKAAKLAAMLENSERSVLGVRMGKSGPLERAELANQIQGFRTSEMLKKKIKIIRIIANSGDNFKFAYMAFRMPLPAAD